MVMSSCKEPVDVLLNIIVPLPVPCVSHETSLKKCFLVVCFGIKDACRKKLG